MSDVETTLASGMLRIAIERMIKEYPFHGTFVVARQPGM